MYNQFIFLCLQTFVLWFLVIFLHRQKERFTLIPLYSFLAILMVLTHNLSDLKFAIEINNWYLLISSFSFFTSLMLGVLILYLFEGPRATRMSLYIILFSSFLYIDIVYLLGLQVDTSNWVSWNIDNIKTYFWSITAIIVDVFFIAIFWELLGKIKKIPLLAQIFLVIFGTFLIDSLIFATGVFLEEPLYWSVLQGSLLIRIILSVVVSPIIFIYLKTEKYNEAERERPKKIWEILNFRSELESKIESMEEVLKKQKKLEEEIKKSEEKYALALEGTDAGIWDWDITKDVISYSPKFFSLLKIKEGDIVNTLDGFKNILHPDDIDKTFSLVDKSLKNKEKYSTEFRLKNGDGSYKWYLSSGITKFDPSGKAIRMVGSIININDRKIISESYAEKVAELEQFNKLMVNREIKMAELKEQIQKLTEEKNLKI